MTDYHSLNIGDTWLSHGRTLTETDLGIACMTSGDWHPIHADAEVAAQSALGQRVIHGSYGLHVAIGMATPYPPLGGGVIAALGLSEWRYFKPLFVGDTVSVRVEIVAKRVTSTVGRGLITTKISLQNKKDVLVQEGLSRMLVHCRHPS